MPQTFFKNLISVDWLSMMVKAFDLNFASIQQEDYIWNERQYGSKQFHHIVDIEYIDEDGAISPFATFCYEPTLSSWPPDMCSMKLANNVFYCDNKMSWQRRLNVFMNTYRLQVVSISRCDLACDFLYLLNRVSGPKLVEKLKTFQWWKCGTVKCCEFFKMPYTIDQPAFCDDKSSDVQIYLQQGKLQARTESLTFGTMSSDAQVCIYDKTLELMRSETEVDLCGEKIKVSAKEYIRDAHKAAGVWSDERHTWRVEIRLRNKAVFITDQINGMSRPLYIEDLEPANLPTLFHLAAQKYFGLVDATLGGQREVTAEVLSKFSAHKERLPIIDLFRPSTMLLRMSKKKYQKNPTKFTKAVISCLDRTSEEIDKAPSSPIARNLMPDDSRVLREAAMIMRCLYAGQYADIRDRRNDLYETTFRDLYDFFNQGFYVPRRVVNLLYSYIFSTRYVSIEFLQKIVQHDIYCNFYQWLRCNCNIVSYYEQMNIPSSEERWVPPVIAPEYQRKEKNLLNKLLYEQH